MTRRPRCTTVDWRGRFIERDAGYPTPCREWTGSTAPGGYGQVRIGGVLYRVPRLAWAEAHGDPGDLLVCHHCDNPPCFREDHLFLGTQAVNGHDMSLKGRAPRGEQQGCSKLTEEDVLAIRASVGLTQRELGAAFDCSPSMVGCVLRGENWTHV